MEHTPQRRRTAGQAATVVVLVFAMFQVVLGSTLPSGLYALYEAQWSVSRAQTTIIFAMYVAGVLLGLFGLGSLADTRGRRIAITLSITLAVASSGVFVLAGAVWPLFLGRLLSGLSVGVGTGAFTAALCDTLGTVKGSSLSAITIAAALAAGPVASAVVAEVHPQPLRAPFVVHLVLLSVSLVACLRLTNLAPGTRRRRAGRAHHPTTQDSAAAPLFPSRHSAWIFLVSTSAIGWAYGANGMWQSVVPLTAFADNPPQLQIAVMTATMLGISAVCQIFTMSRDPRGLLAPGLIILGLALIGARLALQSTTLGAVWVATCVVGIGQGLSSRSSLSLVTANCNASRRATAVSRYYSFGYIITAAAPLSANLLSVPTVLTILGVLSLGSAVGFLILRRHGASPPTPTPA
ncbi:hypothetical protein C1Y63_11185 [Corynebacterium sp. 13CS0277]|uniref:MFS transporter n=1 Tax=Corynebacterium sp. 13CS0277 TaxID=2071994 RepID=UPI000D026421|nr:MFS transporter [Corynebacterium sp. 13CS0277]PRQ10492.1 hypothetical protein C1Y63_11185 [Corynebacterium sp. 13CS0277]